MNRIFSRAIVSMALFLSLQASAQTSGLGTWNVVSAKLTFNKQWNAFAEAQLRSQKTIHDFNYYEYKAGVGYNFPKNVSALLAMGHYVTYQPEGDFTKPFANNEFRIWEQFVLTNNIGRVKLEHRYRFEQRFTSAGYRNRFRYRLNAVIPLNHTEVKDGTWYTSVFNEFFVANEGPYFEQNRIYAGIGYQFNSNLTLQAGWLNRFDQSITHTVTWKNYFQTMLMFSLDEFKSGRERHPSSVD
ncbi:MAG: hypothetical protein JWQ78_515 [Sediminibacterium sp.]|nr:hypothetical protein [Sediminibacterium sp.]